MNNLKNKVQIIGRLSQDPEIINFETGSKIAKFTIAANEYHKDSSGETKQYTEWIPCEAWNKRAEIIEKYIRKGKEIAIEGKLKTETFETKEGEKRFKMIVLVNDILMLGGKNEN